MSDPFDYRCPRCGIAMLDPGECGRGPACRTQREFWGDILEGVRHAFATAGRGMLRVVRSVVDE